MSNGSSQFQLFKKYQSFEVAWCYREIQREFVTKKSFISYKDNYPSIGTGFQNNIFQLGMAQH